jgi:hypothetical protein
MFYFYTCHKQTSKAPQLQKKLPFRTKNTELNGNNKKYDGEKWEN